MPVIAFASPKGGCGKSTSALLLATEIAQRGLRVCVIDADPETYIDAWSKLPDKPSTLTVIKSPTETSILDDIQRASETSSFVIIDLEGTASMTVVYAISASDLVIIPVQASDLDARGASKALQLVRQQERAFRKTIPHAILFTRMKAAIRTRTFTHIEEELKKAAVPMFRTHLMERDAYRALFSYGGTLASLEKKDVYKKEEAIANAQAYVAEVIAMVRGEVPAGTAVEEVATL